MPIQPPATLCLLCMWLLQPVMCACSASKGFAMHHHFACLLLPSLGDESLSIAMVVCGGKWPPRCCHRAQQHHEQQQRMHCNVQGRLCRLLCCMLSSSPDDEVLLELSAIHHSGHMVHCSHTYGQVAAWKQTSLSRWKMSRLTEFIVFWAFSTSAGDALSGNSRWYLRLSK